MGYTNIFARLARLFDRNRASRPPSPPSEADDEPSAEMVKLFERPGFLEYVLSAAEAGAEKCIDTPERVTGTVEQLRKFPTAIGQTPQEVEELGDLLYWIRDVKDGESPIFSLLRNEVQGELIRLLRSGLVDEQFDDDIQTNLFKILQTLAGFQTAEATREIAHAARFSLCSDNGLWTIVQEKFLDDHPFLSLYFDEVREAPPRGEIRENLLYVSVMAALGGKMIRSPFDSGEGLRQLETWLGQTDADQLCLARLVAYDLAGVESAERSRLLDLADRYPDMEVRINAAWSRTKCGDESRLGFLIEVCRHENPELQSLVRSTLRSLKRDDLIPT